MNISPETADLINASFEMFGAVFVWLNVKQLYIDKTVKGIDWRVTAFWTAWGVWNLFYYPALGQHLSFYAGIILVIGNLTWVGLLAYYKWRKPTEGIKSLRTP